MPGNIMTRAVLEAFPDAMRALSSVRWLIMRALSMAVGALSLLAASGTAHAQPFNYAEALQKSEFFYEAQRSGVLPRRMTTRSIPPSSASPTGLA